MMEDNGPAHPASHASGEFGNLTVEVCEPRLAAPTAKLANGEGLHTIEEEGHRTSRSNRVCANAV